ncbi:MAG: hypothetical protein R6W06_11040 [Prochlorococcaceae cyanobacterium]
MADDNNTPTPQHRSAETHTSAETDRDNARGGDRGGRGPQREPGGFRIRLSDNEMRAVRAVQDAFNLRSPVAALGFSVRSIAQLLEQGQLDELVAQQRAQSANQGTSRQPDGPRGGGNRPSGGRRTIGEGRQERERSAPRIDPLARPQKPAPASVTITESGTESGSESGNEPEPMPADAAVEETVSVADEAQAD